MKTEAEKEAEKLIKKFAPHSYCDASGRQRPYAIENALIYVEGMRRVIVSMTPKDDPYSTLFALEFWEDVQKHLLIKANE